jgi:flavin reductase (DIM6/NTAB) family NADH-FMN oxidoreductase RutF
MEKFVSVPKLDNFYQTSAYFPMPVVLVSTVAPSGITNLGPYSLCFPHEVSGRHAMILICRNSSNTATNIRRDKVCAINFLPFSKKYMANCVVLGFPGETPEEKMKNSMFTLVPSQRTPEERTEGVQYPEIVDEAFQVFECTWDETADFFENEDSLEIHFVLRIDKIVMKDHWYKNLLDGKGFPIMPVDFGFRNNMNFWLSKHSKPYAKQMPKGKGQDLNTVMYQAKRTDPDITWEKEACEKLVGVPRPFLPKVMRACAEKAKEQGVTTITPEFLDKIRDKRNKEKEK